MAIHQRRAPVVLGKPENRAQPWRGTDADSAAAKPARIERRSGFPNSPAHYGAYGNLAGGGYQNAATGAGTSRDATAFARFLPTRFIVREALETIYVESWAAKKLIRVPVEDAVNSWRNFIDDEDGVMAMAEKRHNVRRHLADAWRAGRAYGTGMAILFTAEAPMEEPLNPDAIRPGDLRNIVVVDRYSVNVDTIVSDPFNPAYGTPEMYRVYLGDKGESMDVHPSRVLRFDGVRSMSGEWRVYEPNWGISVLVDVLKSIYEDVGITSAIAHKVESFATTVLKMNGFESVAAVNGFVGPSTSANETQRMARTKMMESVYGYTVIDREDELTEKSVTFAGISDIMDRFHLRLAAAADIPATRFLAKSPDGMNATGDSDLRNYATHVQSLKENVLAPCLSILDVVLARDAGLAEPPPYDWVPMFALTEKEEADIRLVNAQAAEIAMRNQVMDEEEARDWLVLPR